MRRSNYESSTTVVLLAQQLEEKANNSDKFLNASALMISSLSSFMYLLTQARNGVEAKEERNGKGYQIGFASLQDIGNG